MALSDFLRSFRHRLHSPRFSRSRNSNKRGVELVTISGSLLDNIELEHSAESPAGLSATVPRNDEMCNRITKSCVKNVKNVGNIVSPIDTQTGEVSTENPGMPHDTLLERVPLRGMESSEWSAQEDPTGLIRMTSKRHRRTVTVALAASFLALAILIAFSVGAIIIRNNYNMYAIRNNGSAEVAPNEQNLLKHPWILPDVETRISNISKSSTPIIIPIPILFKSVNDTDIQNAIIAGKTAYKKREEIEHHLLKAGKVPSERSDASRHQYFHKTTSESKQISSLGFTVENAYKFLTKRLNASTGESRKDLLRLDLQGKTLPPEWCTSLKEIQCNGTSPYRTEDGSCNNLAYNMKWGSTNQPFRRILLPYYADGVSSLRSKAVNGESLPSPREISLKVHINNYQDDTSVSLMLPLWGQFIENDMISIAGSTGPNGSSISCCDKVSLLEHQHPECIPILTPAKNVSYRTPKGQCMTVIRSAPYPNCELGPRQQFNQVSSFLDASHIYGSSRIETDALRAKKNGLLKTFLTKDGRSLLPIILDPNDECNNKEELLKDHYCFKSGTARVNEITSLTALHTVWMRQHNKIANNLELMNPHWDDETLFQETRRIVTAQIQHLTYNEFLPAVVGPTVMNHSGMELLTDDFYTKYDANLNPSISNVFATTAIRFSYSMMQGVIQMIGPETKANTDFVQLRTMQFNPFPLWTEGKLDAILRGMANAPAAKVDTYFTTQLSQHFQHDSSQMVDDTAFDFVAANIQLGRDHGLETYTDWREICGLTVVKQFSELTEIWDDGAALLISDAYRSIQDVDVYTGLLAEKPVAGGMVGETMACLLTDQFLRLKQGDRFWYEGDIQYKPFSSEQLQVIRQTTLARVLCDNSDNLKEIQMNSMMQKSPSNPLVSCRDLDIPKLNYGPWREFSLKTTSRSSIRTHSTVNGSHYSDLDAEIWTKDDSENSAERKSTSNGNKSVEHTIISHIAQSIQKSSTERARGQSHVTVTASTFNSKDKEKSTTEIPKGEIRLPSFTITHQSGGGVKIEFPKNVTN